MRQSIDIGYSSLSACSTVPPLMHILRIILFLVNSAGNGISENPVTNNIKENTITDGPRNQRSKSQKSASKRSVGPAAVNDKQSEQPSMVNGTSA